MEEKYKYNIYFGLFNSSGSSLPLLSREQRERKRVRKRMRVQSSVVCVAADQRQWEDTNNALLALFFPDGKPIPPIMDRAMLKSSDI